MLVARITFTIDAGNATTTPAGLPGWGPRQMNPTSVEGSGSVRRRMSDKLQFVARNDKLIKLIEHQTDPHLGGGLTCWLRLRKLEYQCR